MNKQNHTIPAVAKSIQLLNCLAGTTATQLELRRALSISMSTTYRILQTFLEAGFVKKSPEGVYSLSMGLLPLVSSFREDLNLLDQAKNMVRLLSEKESIACKLSIRCGDLQQTLFRAEPPSPIALTGVAGSTFPVIEGSVGAALLCRCSDAELLRLCQVCPETLEEKLHPDLLVRAVHCVQKDGYFLNTRRNRWNIYAMSVPLFDHGENVAGALTLIGEQERFSGKKRAHLVKALLAVSSKISCQDIHTKKGSFQ